MSKLPKYQKLVARFSFPCVLFLPVLPCSVKYFGNFVAKKNQKRSYKNGMKSSIVYGRPLKYMFHIVSEFYSYFESNLVFSSSQCAHQTKLLILHQQFCIKVGNKYYDKVIIKSAANNLMMPRTNNLLPHKLCKQKFTE